MNYSLKIGHIFPDLLDMYGDSGNIASLTKRLSWRGYDAEVISFKSGNKINLSDIDILLLGGGSDAAESQALSLLLPYKEDLKNFVESGKCLLAVCGGFPMLGKHIDNKPCLDVLDIYTENQPKRVSGNVVLAYKDSTIVGFENHFGKTFIGNLQPLGKILKGAESDNAYEGVRYKNVFATYLHGPLLPKNPSLADEILTLALSNKYGENISLSHLDDSLEQSAHTLAENL